MADTADFQTMYAMLKVHSANQAKEIERLKEQLATPPADAALADEIKRACAYYQQAGRVGSAAPMLAKQHEATADKIISAALRARAVPEGVCPHCAKIVGTELAKRCAASQSATGGA